MAKSVTFTCDCGCGSTSSDHERATWFTLDQATPKKDTLDPKIDRQLQFKSIECLKNWSEKALAVTPGLQKQAESLSPRGSLISREVAGMYV